jgi:hypothetical protein
VKQAGLCIIAVAAIIAMYLLNAYPGWIFAVAMVFGMLYIAIAEID